MNDFKIIKQGAESKIYVGVYMTKPTVVKERFRKKYRNSELDAFLTKERMKAEARAIVRCKTAGLFTPCIYLVDFDRRRIYMEHLVNSITVKEFIYRMEKNALENNQKLISLSQLIGINLGIMHQNNIIHGDLTTSNMLLVNKNDKNEFDTIEDLNLYLIDFGLSYIEPSAEDKGVDLYVLERAIISTHKVMDKLIPVVYDGYKTSAKKSFNEVMNKLEEVRARGRKRTMVG